MKIKNFIYIIGAAFLLTTSSCSDYLDINDDPNRPTVANLPQLLSGSQVELGQSIAPGSYIGTVLPSYVFHLSSREVDNYGIHASYSSLGNTWMQHYLYALKNTEDVIKTAEAGNNTHYAGIAKLMKVVGFTNVVDLWGDVPYSEFYVEENSAPKLPKPDSSKDIYNDLLNIIDEAITDLKVNDPEKNILKPGLDDLFYGGSITKWIKMGNTLKLKLLVQSRKAKSDISNWDQKLSSVLAENNFIGNGEDFQFKRTEKDNPDERNRAFVSEYLGGQNTYYISPWLYETMNGQNLNVTDNPFIGIQDPRVPYFWVNQIKATQDAQAETDYRDGAFVSIFFASNSGNAPNAQRSTATMIGIYPCGGKYDDGSAGTVGAKDGTGKAPEKLLMAYSVPFLKAELYLTGEATGDAKEMLEQGIRASIQHVNTVSLAAKKNQEVPEISSQQISDFVEQVLAKYDLATSNEEKLRIVMTQKWIANFFHSVEAYTDMRRTGYPRILDKTTTTALSPYMFDKKPEKAVTEIPLKGINAFPRAMWYPTSEDTRNPNVTNEGRNLASPIVFWDK